MARPAPSVHKKIAFQVPNPWYPLLFIEQKKKNAHCLYSPLPRSAPLRKGESIQNHSRVFRPPLFFSTWISHPSGGGGHPPSFLGLVLPIRNQGCPFLFFFWSTHGPYGVYRSWIFFFLSFSVKRKPPSGPSDIFIPRLFIPPSPPPFFTASPLSFWEPNTTISFYETTQKPEESFPLGTCRTLPALFPPPFFEYFWCRLSLEGRGPLLPVSPPKPVLGKVKALFSNNCFPSPVKQRGFSPPQAPRSTQYPPAQGAKAKVVAPPCHAVSPPRVNLPFPGERHLGGNELVPFFQTSYSGKCRF